jgi:DNA-binding HxlR family transcriptional regulator
MRGAAERARPARTAVRTERVQEPSMGQMAGQGRPLGVPVLQLLAEEWTVPILRELTTGPLRPTELEERLPRAPHSAIMRALRDLRASSAVSRHRTAGLSPRADYALTDAGHRLIDIPGAAERWARNWSPPDSGRRPAGRIALRLAADEPTRTILLSLASGPLRAIALDEQLPHPRRSATRDRLAQLIIAGILIRSDIDHQPHYALTPSARRLSLIGLLAGHWERRWTADMATDSGDLPGLLRLLAPVVQTPEFMAGVCRLHIATGAAEQDIYLVAEHGRLAALPGHAAPPEAQGSAPLEAWCDALLHSRLAGITTSGNAALMATMLTSITSTLLS